jgi:carbon-monoxide dehydrogenase large subunit
LLELARDSADALLPKELSGGLAVAADNEMHDPVFPNGCAICECEVDSETGAVEVTRFTAVDDVGRCINPLIVHGQTHGGAAQGIGQAISEICWFDPETGQAHTGSLMDYAIPRADTLPAFDAEIVEVLSPTNPLGIKAAGEGATTPAPAAVINAIVDALADFGVRDIALPATPQNVWRTIRAAGKR